MKTIQFTTAKECYSRQHEAGRYNPGRVALFNRNRFRCIAELPHGSRDDCHLFVDGSTLYALSINRGLGYCGLTAFDLASREKDKHGPRWLVPELGEVFLQADHEIESVLGKRGLDLAPITIAKILAEYCHQ